MQTCHNQPRPGTHTIDPVRPRMQRACQSAGLAAVRNACPAQGPAGLARTMQPPLGTAAAGATAVATQKDNKLDGGRDGSDSRGGDWSG